ncbi:hypothetical protein D3C75_321970 [compost metagenome]
MLDGSRPGRGIVIEVYPRVDPCPADQRWIAGVGDADLQTAADRAVVVRQLHKAHLGIAT